MLAKERQPCTGPPLPGAGASWETEPSPNQEGNIKRVQVGKGRERCGRGGDKNTKRKKKTKIKKLGKHTAMPNTSTNTLKHIPVFEYGKTKSFVFIFLPFRPLSLCFDPDTSMFSQQQGQNNPRFMKNLCLSIIDVFI